MTRWLVANTRLVKGGKIEWTIPERPLLHVCAADDHFGDVNVDIRPEVHPDKVCDVTKEIPFPNDSFAAAFGDFPWVGSWKFNAPAAIREMLRVAPIAYVISPWVYGSKICTLETVYVSQRPGINNPILFCKYVRKNHGIDEEDRTPEPFGPSPEGLVAVHNKSMTLFKILAGPAELPVLDSMFTEAFVKLKMVSEDAAKESFAYLYRTGLTYEVKPHYFRRTIQD